MNQESNTEEWNEAIRKFSHLSDGFWIMGYRDGGNQKFACGRVEDPALEDALFLPQITATRWTQTIDENDSDDSQE